MNYNVQYLYKRGDKVIEPVRKKQSLQYSVFTQLKLITIIIKVRSTLASSIKEIFVFLYTILTSCDVDIVLFI